MIDFSKPSRRPANPRFSSGPCPKPPGWNLDALSAAELGRSHRSPPGRARLRQLIELTREVLKVPSDYRIGIVPASDTGAVEIALWSLLGARGVEVLAWDSFGHDWVADVTGQLKIDAQIRRADYGKLPDVSECDFNSDIVFTWNGTTSGAKLPNGDFIPNDRAGLTICDATSAVFAVDLPWQKLDVTTFSWQKVLGGEGAHGMLILSPRAIERLETYTPDWPMPKIFRLTSKGRVNEGIFDGATINTPSMLCVEDCIVALKWTQEIGGLSEMIRRANANSATLDNFVQSVDWLAHLVTDSNHRSNTSVCLIFQNADIPPSAKSLFAKNIVARLEKEGAAFDIGAYRAAPPGLRIWCGGTVEQENLLALFPWIEWAYQIEHESYRS